MLDSEAVTANSSQSLHSPSADCSEITAVARMWLGGPLRQFTPTQAKSHYIGYSGPILTGFAGSYICDGCKGPSGGVYLLPTVKKWLCGRSVGPRGEAEVNGDD